MSTSGGTRAARAATSRQVKQELVRVLFGKKYSKKGREAHSKLDYSIYSYADLRKAYLSRLQEIHPDKNKHNNDINESMTASIKKQFHDLQNAWDNYDEMASALKKKSNGDKEESNFTMFGVGCSFSDSDEERARRHEITDQACRGWFSSGQLPDNSTVNGSASANMRVNPNQVSLADEDMFEEVAEDESRVSTNDGSSKKQHHKSLIPGLGSLKKDYAAR